MPFVLPPSLIEADELALVLAYGKLSVLESCAVLGHSIHRAEAPTERVSVLTVDRVSPDNIARLAGAHKCAPLVDSVESSASEPAKLVGLLSDLLEEKSNVSLSGYGIDEDEYDELVRSLLDGIRNSGLRKVRLLRPKGGELLAEQVLSREAVDVIAFPRHGSIALGPTTWVPDSTSMRSRGTKKPSPHPDISLSPRLARVLVNLAGLEPGQTILDPFCGSGTILAEAYSMSMRCLGLDSSASRVQDARENLRWTTPGSNASNYDIRKGDARELYRLLHGSKVNAIVSEPLLLPRLEARPKLATAKVMLDEASDVYARALSSMADSLIPGGRIIVVVPVILTMEGDEASFVLEGRKLGLKLLQPGPVGFEYPIRLSFESTRWVRRAVYAFESLS